MQKLTILLLTTAMALTACTQNQLPASSTSRSSPIASNLSADDISRRNVERRAIEAVMWGMPAVNFERMLQAAIDNGAAANQVVYWSRPANWKDQTLTPNPDTIYLNPPYDTTSGPVVLEVRKPKGTSRSPAASTPPGGPRWKTSGPQAWTKARPVPDHAAGIQGQTAISRRLDED
jgi:hypothetical protein